MQAPNMPFRDLKNLGQISGRDRQAFCCGRVRCGAHAGNRSGTCNNFYSAQCCAILAPSRDFDFWPLIAVLTCRAIKIVAIAVSVILYSPKFQCRNVIRVESVFFNI